MPVISTSIELTKSQAELVNWALTGPIADYGDIEQIMWDRDCPREEAEAAIRDRDATRLDGTTLTLSCDQRGHLASDLLNMLEDVATDIADGFGMNDAVITHGPKTATLLMATAKRSANSAAVKIRKALGID